MKKSLLILSVLALFTACGSLVTNDPYQQALNNTTDTCKGVGASIKSTDALVLNGSISKANATKVASGLAAANAGCNSALAALQAASGAAK